MVGGMTADPSSTGTESAPVLLSDAGDGVTVLTLNLPDRRNAMTEAMTVAWTEALAAIRADPAVRCVVVTGAGRAFCAGGDLSWIGEVPDMTVPQIRDRMLRFYRSWLAISELEVPTIAAVNGAAVGAGLALALACDLRYATPEAKLAAPFTALGMHPGMASTWLLPQVAGMTVARDLLLTGRTVAGTEALGLGLVNGLCAAEDLEREVLATARTIARHAPVATRLTKAALRGTGHASIADALQWESLAQATTMAGEDLQEGLAAQRERRAPRFTGS